ncbi:MAG: EamA family transporter, partial [Hyphomicrobiales bacterium]|nr:EamA family transporter [Hyphomicrobiales bacterium]
VRETGAWLPADTAGWTAFFGMMVLSGLIPQFAIVIGTPAVGPGRAAVAATLELVVALSVGWLVIGEAAGPADYFGAGLILVAILLAVTDRVG